MKMQEAISLALHALWNGANFAPYIHGEINSSSIFSRSSAAALVAMCRLREHAVWSGIEELIDSLELTFSQR
jgi:hypothetical protein